MDPSTSLVHELDYELKLRKAYSNKANVCLKRKALKRLLEKEIARDPVFDLSSIDLEVEVSELKNSCDEVKELIERFDRSSVDASVQEKKILSRFAHIQGRLNRLPIDDRVEMLSYREFRDEYRVLLLSMEDDLEEGCQKEEAVDRAESSIGPGSIQSQIQSVVVKGKGIPVFKWDLKFDGARESVSSFLERVEELRVARNCSKEEVFASAIDLFSGTALIWFRSIRGKVNDWDSLVKLIRRDFLPSDYDDVLWEQIKDRIQGKNEQVTIFIAVLENLFSRLTVPCSEQLKIKYIRRNLLPCYSSALALVDAPTVEALSELCRKIEDANISVKHPTTSKIATLEQALTYNTTKPTSDGSRLKCWNCDEDGHVRRDCRKPKRPIHCFGCNEPGVIKPNCPKCTPTVSSPKN